MTPPGADFPAAGDVVRMARAGTAIRITRRVAEGGQGVVYQALTESGGRVAVKRYRPTGYADRQRQLIAALAAHTRPHPAYAWPIDIVESSGINGFGYVMHWVPERFGSLVELLRAAQQPPSGCSPRSAASWSRVRRAARERAVLPGHQLREPAG